MLLLWCMRPTWKSHCLRCCRACKNLFRSCTMYWCAKQSIQIANQWLQILFLMYNRMVFILSSLLIGTTPHRCSAYEMQGHFHIILVRFYIHHILISEPSQQWSCLHTTYLSLFSEPSNNWYINVVFSNSYFCLSYDWMLLICWCYISVLLQWKLLWKISYFSF